MKDEIKEILDDLDYAVNRKRGTITLNQKDINLLLDYITNLQEEIHKKEAMYDSLAVDYRLSQEENGRLRKELELCKKNGEI